MGEGRVVGVLLGLIPTGIALFLVVLVLGLVHRTLSRVTDPSKRFWNQWIVFGLGALGALVVLLSLPLGTANRASLLSFLGIVTSAAIALSSTTFLGNILAGLMLRAVRNFRSGDFIRCGDYFGRVSQRGLFHTEIQTEYRELVTLPNMYLVTHPTTTVRSSGTVVSATVSLGYDVSHARIEELCLQAVEAAELKEGFVFVDELGDFSVTYRVAGILEDVKRLVSVRSRLRVAILDALHAGGIEIVSPNFMNQRPLAEGKVFIPPVPKAPPMAEEPAKGPDSLLFDKADEAASLEILNQRVGQIVEKIQELEEAAKQAPDDGKEAAEKRLEDARQRKVRLEAFIAARHEKMEQQD